MRFIATIILGVVAAFYAYGALVHVLNMASLNGFDLSQATLKWQLLDIVYLVLDIIVAVGLPLRWRVGYWAFCAAALSQIFLYTVFRTWVLDVPENIARTANEAAYLNNLVLFHIVTIVLVSLSIWLHKKANSTRPV